MCHRRLGVIIIIKNGVEMPVSTGQTWVMGMKKVEMEERGISG